MGLNFVFQTESDGLKDQRAGDLVKPLEKLVNGLCGASVGGNGIQNKMEDEQLALKNLQDR